MEDDQKYLWILRTATILNMTIPVRKRLPPLEYGIEEADNRILPHIQIIFELAKDRSLVQPIAGLEFLFAYGSYHTPHPTSHEMFDLARYLAQGTQSLFLELLVTCWGAATSICKVPLCCHKSKKPILLTLESLPKDSQASKLWPLDNQSPALNALYLRLAFNLEQAKYKERMGNVNDQNLIGWIVQNADTQDDSNKAARMSTERVMSCWRPTSSLMGDLEQQACMLQDLFNVTFGATGTQAELQSLQETEAKLVHLFNAFITVSSFHEAIFARLASLSLTPGCPFHSSLEAIHRILTLSYKAKIDLVWAPLAEATAGISVRARNSHEKSDVLELFRRLEKREAGEKPRRQGEEEPTTHVSDPLWTRFRAFYDAFDTPANETTLANAGREMLYFLLTPRNRNQALYQLSKLLSTPLIDN